LNTLTRNNVVELPIKAIHQSKFPLRKLYEEEMMVGLGQSVARFGTIYPVVVRPTTSTGTQYELIIGSRRLAIAKRQEETTIMAVVLRDVDDQRTLELMLTENLQRQDMTPFEEASGFFTLAKTFHLSERVIAQRLGVKEALVRNRLKLLSLPAPVQKMVAEKRLGIPQVEKIASLSKQEDQLRFAEEAVANGLSQSEVTTSIRQEFGKRMRAARRNPKQFTGRRVSLKIDHFANWLKEITKYVKEMDVDDQRLIFKSLDGLREVAQKIKYIPLKKSAKELLKIRRY